MRYYFILIELLIWGVLIVSCNESDIIELPKSEPKLVSHIVGISTNGKYSSLYYRWDPVIGLSYDVLETFHEVNCQNWNPRITISDGDNTINTGFYSSTDCQRMAYHESLDSIRPQPGKKYNLLIDDGIHSPISSEYTHPDPVPFIINRFEFRGKGQFDYFFTTPLEGRYFDLELKIEDPLVDNFYQLQVIHRIEFYEGEYYYGGASNILYHELLGLTSFGNVKRKFFDDKTFLGEDNILKLNLFLEDWEPPSDKITGEFLVVQLRNYSSELFKYYQDYYLQSLSENDPTGSPMPIQTNIEGGYGVFGGYAENEQVISVDLLNN